MKRTIVAILAMSPAMLLGRAQSPAQPSSTPVLQASAYQPAALVASVKSADTAASLTAPVRISTGVVPPQIMHKAEIKLNSISALENFGGERTVVISMTVNQTGTPVDLKVIQSADAYTDAAVLKAVSGYRYKPATLDNQAVPVTVNLAYVLK